jgi:phosphoribosylaminoimidazolecarboxamide formyltransferase/IMP cyclohydrolase
MTPAGQLKANDGATTMAFRQKLALTAYSRTAAYDTAVSTWLAGEIKEPSAALPQLCRQAGPDPALWREPASGGGVLCRWHAPPRRGDGAAVAGQGAVLQQHQRHRCGVRTGGGIRRAVPRLRDHQARQPLRRGDGGTLTEAYQRAYHCDQTSAFGGIVALNQVLDAATAEEIVKIFTEVVIAPDATDEARAIFAAKKNLRLLTTGPCRTRRPRGWRSSRWRAAFWCRTAMRAILQLT